METDKSHLHAAPCDKKAEYRPDDACRYDDEFADEEKNAESPVI